VGGDLWGWITVGGLPGATGGYSASAVFNPDADAHLLGREVTKAPNSKPIMPPRICAELRVESSAITSLQHLRMRNRLSSSVPCGAVAYLCGSRTGISFTAKSEGIVNRFDSGSVR